MASRTTWFTIIFLSLKTWHSLNVVIDQENVPMDHLKEKLSQTMSF